MKPALTSADPASRLADAADASVSVSVRAGGRAGGGRHDCGEAGEVRGPSRVAAGDPVALALDLTNVPGLVDLASADERFGPGARRMLVTAGPW
jgi:hypothetical protein